VPDIIAQCPAPSPPTTTKRCAHASGPVNIGNPGEFTIKQLAELAVKMTVRLPRTPRLNPSACCLTDDTWSELQGSSSKIIHLPLPGDDPKQRKPDITKARKYLQWEPKIPLEKGIVHTIKYFRELDLGRFKKPTKHTAHLNTDSLESEKKRQKTS